MEHISHNDLTHRHERNAHLRANLVDDRLVLDVATGTIELDARQRRHKLEALKAVPARLGLAHLEDRPPHALSGPTWMHEERANLSRIGGRVEHTGVTLGVAIAAEQRFPATPSAASDRLPGVLGDKIRSIQDEIGVDAKDGGEGCLDLLVGVVIVAQAARRLGDELIQRRAVVEPGFSESEIHAASQIAGETWVEHCNSLIRYVEGVRRNSLTRYAEGVCNTPQHDEIH